MIMNEKSYPKLQKLKGTYFLPYLAFLKGRYMYSPTEHIAFFHLYITVGMLLLFNIYSK